MLKLLNLNGFYPLQGSIVSAITGTSGGSGPAAGVGFQAQAADLQTPVTDQQAAEQYQNAQNALGGQQAFLAAVQAQNGLGNQSQVYNQLQGVANGTGPNPAQTQLAQATGANTANQAALMAGQRGSSQNAGLIARQAAQQGATNQQNSAGQAASLQAQQSLGALGQAGTLATNQANQQAGAQGAVTQSALNEQQNILSGVAAQNSAKVGQTSSMNSANAGIANTVAGGQLALAGNVMNGIGGAAMALAAGGVVDPQAQGVSQQAMPAATTAMPQQAAGPKSSMGKFFSPQASDSSTKDKGYQNDPNKAISQGSSSLGQGIGHIFGKLGGSSAQQDTSSPQYQQAQADAYKAYGDQQAKDYTPNSAGVSQGDMSDAIAQQYGSAAAPTNPTFAQAVPTDPSAVLEMDADGGQAGGLMQTAMKLAPMAAMALAQGGKVPALVSPGEKYLPPQAVEAVEQGADPMKVGKEVPGKPKVKGNKNSYANDTIPATLEEGGIVLPRSVTQSKNPHWAAHKFVADIMAKNGKSLPKRGK